MEKSTKKQIIFCVKFNGSPIFYNHDKKICLEFCLKLDYMSNAPHEITLHEDDNEQDISNGLFKS